MESLQRERGRERGGAVAPLSRRPACCRPALKEGHGLPPHGRSTDARLMLDRCYSRQMLEPGLANRQGPFTWAGLGGVSRSLAGAGTASPAWHARVERGRLVTTKPQPRPCRRGWTSWASRPTSQTPPSSTGSPGASPRPHAYRWRVQHMCIIHRPHVDHMPTLDCGRRRTCASTLHSPGM